MRQRVLCSVLKTQYGDIIDLADAITAVRSKGLWLKHHQEEAIFVLDAWRRKAEIRELGLTPSLRLDEPSSPEETIKIFHLYRVLHFFLEDYAKNVPRPEWIQHTQWRLKVLPLDLSDTEKCRFMRGLCRLHIFFNIFGSPEKSVDGTDLTEDNNWFHDTDQKNNYLFWDEMLPWECEELGCVWSYLLAKYKAISIEISTALRNLASTTPCFSFSDITPVEERPPSKSYNIEIVQNLEHFDQYFDILISLGPEFLYRALNADYLLRRNMILVNTVYGYMETDISLDANFWSKRRMSYSQNQHDILDFEQLWSTLPPHEQPNIGWKVAWLVSHTPRRRLHWSFNRNRKLCKDWEWGYAIWDKERLEGWREHWKAPLFEGE